MVLDIHSPRATDRVLDLGCGWGTISYGMAPLAAEVVGLDFSRRAIESCGAQMARHGFDNVVFRVGDARATGLDAGSFDVVVAADLFEHCIPAIRRKWPERHSDSSRPEATSWYGRHAGAISSRC